MSHRAVLAALAVASAALLSALAVPMATVSAAPVSAAPVSAAPASAAVAPAARPTGPVSGACDQAVVRDRRGDGPIDIASIKITSDCRWYQFTLTTHRPFRDSDLLRWGIRLGPGRECGGMESEIIVSWRQDTGLAADYLSLNDRDGLGCGWFGGSLSKATVERLSDRSLRVTLRRPSDSALHPRGFRWFSYALSETQEGVDTTPRFAIQALPTPRLRYIWTNGSFGDNSIAVIWEPEGPVDRYEMQYRPVGGAWSATRSYDPYVSGTTIVGLTELQKYEVRVRAVAWNRPSEWRTRTDTVCPRRTLDC